MTHDQDKLELFLNNLEELLASSSLLGIALSFLAGIVVSVSSPCNYPLIPVTLGIVGAASASSRLKGFYISLLFVLGICFIYTVLGICASFFGVLFFGSIFGNPFTYLVFSLLFFLLGLSHFGLIQLKIPFFYLNYVPKKEEGLSIFIFGVVSGLGLIPCNFHVLGAVLTLISLKRNILYGSMALFVFALGQGLILLILGTFASLIQKLPKTGPWIIRLKRIFASILVGVGCYFFYVFFMMVL